MTFKDTSRFHDELANTQPEKGNPAYAPTTPDRAAAADPAKNAQELFKRLSAGDTEDYLGSARAMADDIKSELKRAWKDLSALDPSGRSSGAQMEQALNTAVIGVQVKYAQNLFKRLCAGKTQGYGGADSMAAEIQEELQQAGKDPSALDPSGSRSAAEMEQELNTAVAAEHVKNAQELFDHLSAGDTQDHGGVLTMVANIRRELQRAGKDVSALDPSGTRSARQMEQAFNAAIPAAHVKTAQELFKRLIAGDLRGYRSAFTMAGDIKLEIMDAGKDLSCLDPSGSRSAAQMEQALNLASRPPTASRPAPGLKPKV